MSHQVARVCPVWRGTRVEADPVSLVALPNAHPIGSSERPSLDASPNRSNHAPPRGSRFTIHQGLGGRPRSRRRGSCARRDGRHGSPALDRPRCEIDHNRKNRKALANSDCDRDDHRGLSIPGKLQYLNDVSCPARATSSSISLRGAPSRELGAVFPKQPHLKLRNLHWNQSAHLVRITTYSRKHAYRAAT